MAITTSISGYWRRMDGDNLELNRRLSESVTVTEGGGNRMVVAAGSVDRSIMPPGVSKVTTLYMETDNEINVELTGAKTASFNIYSDGILAILNASFSNVKVSNRCATQRTVFYDLAG